MRLAFLGPRGTFSEEAALRYAPDAEMRPFPTIAAAAAAVAGGDIDEAVAPIENSLQGAVTETLDLLIHEEGYRVKRELNLSVVHNLMASPGLAIDAIQRVYSHPQALGQCREYLGRNLPHARACRGAQHRRGRRAGRERGCAVRRDRAQAGGNPLRRSRLGRRHTGRRQQRHPLRRARGRATRSPPGTTRPQFASRSTTTGPACCST